MSPESSVTMPGTAILIKKPPRDSVAAGHALKHFGAYYIMPVMRYAYLFIMAMVSGLCLGCAHNHADKTVPAISRKNLMMAPIDPARSVATVQVQEITMAPGQKAPRHLHPCPTIGMVTQGQITFEIEGQPAQILKKGDAFYEPANVAIAKFNNDAQEPATFVAYYLLGPGETKTVALLPR